MPPLQRRKPILVHPERKGEFTRKAKAQGKTPVAYANQITAHQKAHPGSKRWSLRTIEQANFVKRFVSGRKKK
jgi:hypothetical protein